MYFFEIFLTFFHICEKQKMGKFTEQQLSTKTIFRCCNLEKYCFIVFMLAFPRHDIIKEVFSPSISYL